MNRNITLEALDFAIRESQIEFMLKGRTDCSICKYHKLKSAYKALRQKNEYEVEGCVIALKLFKEHLNDLSLNYEDSRDFFSPISDQIINVQSQLDMLNG